jgi:MFS family permease
MTLGILNGVFFNWALAFLSGATVIPLFISGLTDNRLIIGAFSSLEDFGWNLPQFFAGALIAGRPLVMGFYNRLSVLRTIFFAICVALIFAIGTSSPSLLLIGFGLFFALYGLSSGVAGISFMEIVAKAIPNNKRGSFFGSRMFFGGLGAALSGPLVKLVLDKWQFPYNFGYLYCFSLTFIILGLIVFALIRESPKLVRNNNRFGENIKKGLKLLKNDINLKRLIWSRYLSNAYLLASPFYIISAIENLGIPRPLAGTYLSFEMAGFLGANILWGRISNRVSNKLLLRLAAICAIIAPVFALLALFYNPGYFIYGLIFLFNGAAVSGISMGYLNYVLEIIDEDNRPLGVGIVNTLAAPTVLLSGLGGLISEFTNLQILFIITLICLIMAFINISRLTEPARQPPS